MAVVQYRTSAKLYNLSREHDTQKRQNLFKCRISEMIKWFSLAARKILEGKMKLPKQTQKFMDRHKDDVKKISKCYGRSRNQTQHYSKTWWRWIFWRYHYSKSHNM